MLAHLQKYVSCLKDERNKHHLCRELSKDYLQCRMDRDLMASEDLDKVCTFNNNVFWFQLKHKSYSSAH